MGNAGSASGRFRHAIARGDLLAAEMAAREMGGLSLEDALDLCVLLSEQDPKRYRRAAVRWLGRLLTERELEPEEAVVAASSLVALTGRGSREATVALLELTKRPRLKEPLVKRTTAP